MDVGLLAGQLGPVVGLHQECLRRDPDSLLKDVLVEELLRLQLLAPPPPVQLGHGDEVGRIEAARGLGGQAAQATLDPLQKIRFQQGLEK